MPKTNSEGRTVSSSVRITKTGDDLWERIAEKFGVSKQAVFEIAIRKLAEAEGIEVSRETEED